MSDEDGSRGRASKNTDIEEAASDWFALMKSDGCAERDVNEFKTWYNANPNHEKAYQELEKVWEVVGDFADEPEIQTMREEVLRKSATSKSKSRVPLWSIALAAILIVVFLIIIL